jgi:hypothetical protein
MTAMLAQAEKSYAPFAPQQRMDEQLVDDPQPHVHTWHINSADGRESCKTCLARKSDAEGAAQLVKDRRITAQRHLEEQSDPVRGCPCATCRVRRVEAAAEASTDGD